MQGGTLVFTDYHIKPEFSATMYKLGGKISGLSSEQMKFADVDLRGNLRNLSPLSITGKINPLRGDMGWHLSIDKRFNEIRARLYACEVLLALEELHRRDIIFRDLKPDNVVFDEEGHAMLTDFGLSREGVYGTDSAKSFCGSIAYLAPEMLRRAGHGKAVDWYLLGVLIYEMLVGNPPYFSRNREQLFQNITSGALRLPSCLSPNAKSIIRAVITTQLLQREPTQRLGFARDAEEVKQHPFFAGVNWDFLLRRQSRPPSLPRPPLSPYAKVAKERVYGETRSGDASTYLAGWSFVSK